MGKLKDWIGKVAEKIVGKQIDKVVDKIPDTKETEWLYKTAHAAADATKQDLRENAADRLGKSLVHTGAFILTAGAAGPITLLGAAQQLKGYADIALGDAESTPPLVYDQLSDPGTIEPAPPAPAPQSLIEGIDDQDLLLGGGIFLGVVILILLLQ